MALRTTSWLVRIEHRAMYGTDNSFMLISVMEWSGRCCRHSVVQSNQHENNGNMQKHSPLHARITLLSVSPHVNVQANPTMAGFKTPPGVVAHLLHSAASEIWYKKDVLMSSKE